MPTAATPSSPARPTLPPPPLLAADCALFLDVDGCLLGFQDDPRAVTVPAELQTLLQRLHAVLGGALALVSGRGVADLERLFGTPAWPLAGLHGLELRHADGRRRAIAVDPARQKRMHAEVAALAARLEHVQLEDKQQAIALHCRRAPWQWPALREAAEALIGQLPGYELQPGNLVMEFKPAGMNKGQVVAELLRMAPFAGRRPVYLGDDLTDEHGFALVNREHGISVRVGSREPTAARFTLPSPDAVHAWLAQVLETLAMHKPDPQGTSVHADSVGSPSTGST
jgi:trehalose 6-phosphate phosphatase